MFWLAGRTHIPALLPTKVDAAGRGEAEARRALRELAGLARQLEDLNPNPNPNPNPSPNPNLTLTRRGSWRKCSDAAAERSRTRP